MTRIEMAKTKSNIKITNWNFLGGHLVEAIVLIAFGVVFIGAWVTGKLENDKEQWAKIFVPVMGVAALGGGGFLLFDAFRKFALSVELGEKFRYRMLTHSRTRKWPDVKTFKLGWETRKYLKRVGIGYKEHRWRMLIVRFRTGELIKVHVSPKLEEQIQEFASSKLRDLGVTLQVSE
jgi:hypothetical protein